MGNENLNGVLKDKCKHVVDRQVFHHFAQSESRADVSLEYHGEKWDFAVADRGGFVRYFKLDDDGEFIVIETNWRNPRECGSIESQKAALRRQWVKLARRDRSVQLCEPPFSQQNFEECDSDAELIRKWAIGNPKRGTAYILDDMCFVAAGSSPDCKWRAFKGTNQRDDIPVTRFLFENGSDMLQTMIETMRASSEVIRSPGRSG